MSTMEYDSKTWKVESDHTIASISATFLNKGVARNEVIVKEGTPNEIKKFIEGKKTKLLYAWNVKVLTRETLNKNGFIKFRETATLQAEGIEGEGKRFRDDDVQEVGSKGTALVDTLAERIKRKAKNLTLKGKLGLIACLVLFVTLVIQTIRLIRGGLK